eukprot:1719023-Rhodomonas_salina.2
MRFDHHVGPEVTRPGDAKQPSSSSLKQIMPGSTLLSDTQQCSTLLNNTRHRSTTLSDTRRRSTTLDDSRQCMTSLDATTLDANAVSDAWERTRWTNNVPSRLKREADCSCQSRALAAEQRARRRAIGERLESSVGALADEFGAPSLAPSGATVRTVSLCQEHFESPCCPVAQDSTTELRPRGARPAR